MDILLAFLLAIILSFGAGLFYSALVYWMDRYEKEPKILLGAVFLWGAIVAVIGSLIIEFVFDAGINLISPSELFSDLMGGSVSAPFAEEIMKSLAVFIIFLFFRKEFDSVLDGFVYASIVALGFAATENALYLTGAYTENGWTGLGALFFLRVILGGWGHPLFTSLTGIGLAIARLNKNILVKIFAPLGGLMAGMVLHGINNGMLVAMDAIPALVTKALIEWGGWFVIIILMFIAAWREKQRMIRYLQEEYQNGLITQAQYNIACSASRRFSNSLKTFGTQGAKSTRRFYQLCGELAHKKHQFATMGDEGGNQVIIDQIRKEIAVLSQGAVS